MLFAHSALNYFTKERCELIDFLGRQVVIAIQNAKLYQDLTEEKERMTEVWEEARKKLARDLHDGPTQSVAAMAMRLNIIRRMMAKNIDGVADEIVKLEELALRTTKEIRHMLFTLRPLILESQGLIAAVQSMADKMMETYGQKVTLNIDERVTNQLEMGKQGVIFYIIEEATNNARKFANATHIGVQLRSFETGIALLEVADDGIGFDIATMQPYNTHGKFYNLHQRTELISGLLYIDSQLGKGTKIQVYIPLTEEGLDRLHHSKK
jgi:signal transduction histidine kinase